MLYDSTKNVLQSILRSLETTDPNRWDDQTESGKDCLYEMHQMSGSLYTPFKSDRQNANSLAQSQLPVRLTRAIPHAKMMLIAIRHKDRIGAVESGKAALAEMNGTRPTLVFVDRTEVATEVTSASLMRHDKKATRKSRVLVASSGM
jgi:hypothetical protein